jgi:hypothetical protein
MQLFSWLHERMTGRSHRRRAPAHRPTPGFRPQVRALEDRVLLSFTAPVSYPQYPPQSSLALATADVNGDGRPDLLTLVSGYGESAVNVQLNNGNGTFGPAAIWSPGAVGAVGMAVGDVNFDGTPDIVYSNKPSGDGGWPDPPSITVRLGDGHGDFLLATTTPEDVFPDTVTSLALADVFGGFSKKNSSEMDLVAVPANGGDVYVARSSGYGEFDGVNTGYPVPTYSVPAYRSFLNGAPYGPPCEVAVGDFNGDGKPDIVVTSPGSQSVCVLLNTGTGALGAPQTYAVGGDPAAVAVGDFNGDGKADLVTANTNGTVSVLLNNGNGTFGAAQSYAVGGAANSVAIGDFNHDGHADIVTTGAEMDVLLNTGTGTFGAYQQVGPAGSSVVAADFNGDGYPDLAQVDAQTGSIDVLLNTTNWSATPSFFVAGFPASTTAGVSQTVTVTALNADGSVNTGYTGTAHFTSSDPQAVLPADYTFTAADQGVHSFPLALKTAGSQSVTVTDTATGSITGSETAITVNPAAATKFIISGPASVRSGPSFSLTVTVEDAYGNVATGYTGTIQFSSTDSQATLPAKYTFTAADAGKHTFTGLKFRTSGTQTITVTDTLFSSITGSFPTSVL